MFDFIKDVLGPLSQEERQYFLAHVPNVVSLGCDRLVTMLRQLRADVEGYDYTDEMRELIAGTIKLRLIQVESIRSLTEVYDAQVALNLAYLVKNLKYELQVEGRGTLWFNIDYAMCLSFKLVEMIEALRCQARLTHGERRKIGWNVGEFYRSVEWAMAPQEHDRELVKELLGLHD